MAVVTGDKELISKLQELRKVKAKAAIRKGSRAGCKTIAPAAKALAPIRTGKLAAAVKVRALPRSRKWTGTMVSTKVGNEGVFYGSFVTLGTKKLKANNFLKLAADETKASATSAFVEGIKQAIEGAAK